MIKHLFKLIWNKKKANALISIEILISFLVLFGVVTMAALSIYRFKEPLGFSYANVWRVSIDSRLPFDSTYDDVKRSAMQQLLLAIRSKPQIENVATFAMPPYGNSTSMWGDKVNGEMVTIFINNASEGALDILAMRLLSGRWFEEGDRALNYTPVVVNRALARKRFGSESPMGKNPYPKGDSSPTGRGARDFRIVGVIEEFRKDGEFSAPANVCIEYYDIERTTQAMSSDLLIRVRPGTDVTFKEELNGALASTAKGWSFEIKTLEELRRADFKPRIAFMIAVGCIAGFLLLMVALGLIGVLWQNVARRTNEIGLRRALGSSARQVYWQILGELLVLTTFGLIVGTAIVVQFPLLNLIGEIPTGVYAVGLLLSTSLMYGLTVACGLYPSWLAMEIEPAEALHCD